MSQPTNKDYKIETFDDIAKIPADRLEAFANELPFLVAANKEMKQHARVKFPWPLGWLISVTLEPSWLDDGKTDIYLGEKKIADFSMEPK
jgi:hypothetical protein